jgi:hypothetical protein
VTVLHDQAPCRSAPCGAARHWLRGLPSENRLTPALVLKWLRSRPRRPLEGEKDGRCGRASSHRSRWSWLCARRRAARRAGAEQRARVEKRPLAALVRAILREGLEAREAGPGGATTTHAERLTATLNTLLEEHREGARPRGRRGSGGAWSPAAPRTGLRPPTTTVALDAPSDTPRVRVNLSPILEDGTASATTARPRSSGSRRGREREVTASARRHDTRAGRAPPVASEPPGDSRPEGGDYGSRAALGRAAARPGDLRRAARSPATRPQGRSICTMYPAMLWRGSSEPR